MFSHLNYILWNPDVEAFHILGLSIRWYSLCWLIGLLLAYFIVQRLYRQQKIKDELFDPLFLYCFFGILIGARLGHCLFYQPEYYLTSVKHFIEMIVPIHFMVGGGWKFVGYEKVEEETSLTFIGKWTFEANKYQATYRFESATAGKQLPASIAALTPSDSATYENGASVTAQQPAQATYTDTENDGTWTFKGYDAASAVVNKADVEFVGKWEFKANPTNAETYTPQVTEETIEVGQTPDLTDNVTNLPSLPAGTKVVDITPAGQIDTTKPGTYSGTVRVDYPDGSSTEVPVPVNVLPAPVTETYKVTYRFESATADNNLPAEVLSLLPQSGTYTTSSSAAIAFVPEAPMPVEVAVANGTWTFLGYQEVEEGGNLIFVGKWGFEAKQAPSPQPQPQPQLVPQPQPQPSPVPPATPEVKPDQETDSADKAQLNQLVKPEGKPVANDKPAVPIPAVDKAKQATLPNTGSTSLISIEGATTSAILAGLGGLLLGRKREDD